MNYSCHLLKIFLCTHVWTKGIHYTVCSKKKTIYFDRMEITKLNLHQTYFNFCTYLNYGIGYSLSPPFKRGNFKYQRLSYGTSLEKFKLLTRKKIKKSFFDIPWPKNKLFCSCWLAVEVHTC